jgi:hypothetical protein
MKRRRIVIGVVVLVVGATATAALRLVRPVPLEERVQRIQPGMTLGEVEAILGEPPGSYTQYVKRVRIGGCNPSAVKEWDWDEGCVNIRFDAGYRVEDVIFYPYTEPPSALQRIRYHLPW